MQRSVLLFLELTEYSKEVYCAIVNSIGRGYHFCKMNSLGRSELWMIPKTEKEKNEIIAELKALKAVKNLYLVMIEEAVKTTDLADVRKLFNMHELDTSGISDVELLLYLNSVFKLENAYRLEFSRMGSGPGPCQVFIKPSKEYPNYSDSAFEKIKKWMLDEEEILLDNYRDVTATSTQMVTVKLELPPD